ANNSYTNYTLGRTASITGLTGQDSTNYQLPEQVNTCTYVVNKTDYDMSGITFTNATKTYNKQLQGLLITGTLPTGLDDIELSVSYSAGITNVGSVVITATFSTESSNYNTPVAMVATLIVSPATVSILVADQTTMYNTYAQSIVNSTAKWSITEGTVCAGDSLDITLSTNEDYYTDVCEVAITASSANSNYDVTVVNGTFTITPAPVTVTIADRTSVYSEQPATLTASSTVPNIYSLETRTTFDGEATPMTTSTSIGEYYIVGVSTNANYDITFVNQSGDSEYAIYTVTPKYVSVAEIVFASKYEIYNGSSFSITATNVPTGIVVTYHSNTDDGDIFNGAVEKGFYTIVAVFAPTNDNYMLVAQETPYKQARLSIYAKVIEIVWHYNAEYIYTGENQQGSVYATYIDENNATVILTPVFDADFINVGSYIATVTPSSDYNVLNGATLTQQLVINKATHNMSTITFEDSHLWFTDEVKNITINGTLPTGVTVSYLYAEDQSVFTGETIEGEYSVIARFIYDTDNYNIIEDMTATLTIERDYQSEQAFVSAVEQLSTITIDSYDALVECNRLYELIPYNQGVSVISAHNTLVDKDADFVQVVITYKSDFNTIVEAFTEDALITDFDNIARAHTIYNALVQVNQNVTDLEDNKTALDAHTLNYNTLVTSINSTADQAVTVQQQMLSRIASLLLTLLSLLVLGIVKFV
ncbi:MAG: hypothetical protein PHW00_03110, partial [Clostridia bacterium]|nr:hypothetical protein [Clostridia bacterium]